MPGGTPRVSSHRAERFAARSRFERPGSRAPGLPTVRPCRCAPVAPAMSSPRPRTQHSARQGRAREGSGRGPAESQAPRRLMPSRRRVRAIRTQAARGPPRRGATQTLGAPRTRPATDADAAPPIRRAGDRACWGAGDDGKTSPMIVALVRRKIQRVGSADPRSTPHLDPRSHRRIRGSAPHTGPSRHHRPRHGGLELFPKPWHRRCHG